MKFYDFVCEKCGSETQWSYFESYCNSCGVDVGKEEEEARRAALPPIEREKRFTKNSKCPECGAGTYWHETYRRTASGGFGGYWRLLCLCLESKEGGLNTWGARPKNMPGE